MGDPKDLRIDHLLALKVMRLTRPTFACPLVVADPDSKGYFKDVLSEELEKDVSTLKGLETLALSQILILPQSFGNIYLGETFSCYICLHNDSTEVCKKVVVKCDLQTATQRIPLFPTPTSTATPTADQTGVTDELLPGGSIDHVLNHEVKELGTHILVCEVIYTSPSITAVTPGSEKLSFRKFFKFQVMKPLDVKTKFYNAESDEVFLEAQVQNVTTGPLCLEKVCLDPSQLFNVTPLNDIETNSVKKSVFGPVNCLQPQDSRQYLFCLTPKPEIKSNHKLLKGVTNIGKLDIVWRTNMGDRGRLQTSQLQRLAPAHGDIRFTIEYIPSVVKLYEAFRISCKIVNNSERTLDLEILCSDVNSPKMLWSGVISQKLGLVEPSGTIDVTLEIVPHDSGMQIISGVRIIDTLLKRTYDFDDVCQVFVTSDDEVFKAIGL